MIGSPSVWCDGLKRACICATVGLPVQVVVAALEALNECIKLCAYAFDTHMERIMPCLFMRLQDQKDAVRNLSSDVLHGK